MSSETLLSAGCVLSELTLVKIAASIATPAHPWMPSAEANLCILFSSLSQRGKQAMTDPAVYGMIGLPRNVVIAVSPRVFHDVFFQDTWRSSR